MKAELLNSPDTNTDTRSGANTPEGNYKQAIAHDSAVSLHAVFAIAFHEIRTLAANPSMAATALVLIFFALLFTDFFHFFEWFSAPFLCQLAICSIGGIGTVCVLAEERERGAEQTILLTGTSRASIAFGKALACIVVSEFVALVCAFGVLRDIALACETALLLLFTTLPVAFVSVTLGMRLNDQQRASSWGTPILFSGVITAAMETVLNVSPWMLPTGAAPELIDLFVFGNMAPTISPVITCVAGIAYCLIALGLLIQSLRKR